MNKLEVYEAVKFEVFSQEGVVQLIDLGIDAFLEHEGNLGEKLDLGFEVHDFLQNTPKEVFLRHFEGITDEESLKETIQEYFNEEYFSNTSLFIREDSFKVCVISKNDKLKKFDEELDKVIQELEDLE